MRLLLGRVLGVALLLMLLWLGGRIVSPPQMADERHLRLKAAYLEDIAERQRDGIDRTNLVVVLFDDLGYGDLGSYGNRAIRTPHLDRIAASGLRFTDAYAASPYCSASRAALLTGRHPTRMGFDHVLQPAGTWKDLLLRIGARNRQLPGEEITLPEVMHAAGYATGMVGKWHLGDTTPSLPNDRGFDSYFGLLYSNDQGEPVLWRDRQIAEPHPIDQSTLTRRYTAAALEFLAAADERPFFLYLSHTFPHVPLHASAEFRGRSEAGLYGDVVEELDDSVGAVVDLLAERGLTERTLIVVTSDNGPWFQGSPGGLRGRKMDVFEGGMRVPFLVSWPGRVTGGQIRTDVISGLDLLPTVLELLGLPPPADRVLDGVSLASLLTEGSPAPPRAILYTQIRKFSALREGRFKIHARHRLAYGNPMDWAWGPYIRRGPWLFDLARDPDESYDVSARYPEVVDRLASSLEAYRADWLENPRGWTPPR